MNDDPAGASPVDVSVGRPESERAVDRDSTVACIADDELLRRVVRHVVLSRRRRKGFAWAAVSEAFALGSTFSAQLCRRFCLDPDSGADLKTPNVALSGARAGDDEASRP